MSDAERDEPGQGGRRARRSLVEKVHGELRAAILAGAYPVGTRLPTEAELTARHAVSRTVVREAIAALRSEGLAEPRRGAGVFVTATEPPTGALFHNIDYHKLSNVIELLELRASVEIEAAAFAAARRSPAQEEAIYEALDAFETAATEGARTGQADLDFHLAVARATNNPRFEQFLTMLGLDAIPRARLATGTDLPVNPGYAAQLNAEHRRIAEAVSARDPEAARAAMRAHLEGGQGRYRQLLRSTSESYQTTS